jgi:hypothetical protein
MEDAKNGKGTQHLVQVLSKRLSLSEAEWQIGRSKNFLRSELARKLEVLTKLQRLAAARVIGKFGCKIACLQADRLLAACVGCVDKDSHDSSQPGWLVEVLIREMP